MLLETMKRKIISVTRTAFLVVSLACYIQSSAPRAIAAAPGEIDLRAITVTPGRLSPGQHPEIETRIGQVPGGTASSIVVSIIATITRPDHQAKSWNWGKIVVSRGSVRTITVPKEYDTSAAGTYRVEILVYSDDMKHRLARRSHTFDVVERRPSEAGKKTTSEARELGAGKTAVPEQKRPTMEMGLYGNALNTAAGGMVLLWPSKYAGFEGIYATGVFTTYEGRFLVRTDRSQGYNIYGGIGFIHVTAEKKVIGVTTRFSDSGASGVVGVEVEISKKAFLHVEASTARIKLEQIVANGAQTVKASVKYAPVTVGIGLVMMVF
jgi:hypothetical protein